jgi:NAD(P)-dependent dehydrogenase (short-subunit alcohol dehydrogenase family)
VAIPVDLLLADLSSQDAIRQLAHAVSVRYQELHVLVNNAGMLNPRHRTVTIDGLEKTFAVNHLAPFLLTTLLLSHLKASAPARIVTVASSAQHAIDFDDLQHEKRYRVWEIYGQSKLATILFTYELARRLEGSGVTANCLHPGVVSTNLAHDLHPLLQTMARLLFISPEKGVQTSIYLASSPEVEGKSGKYFVREREARSSAASYERASAQRLWQESEQLTRAVTV